jgi:hypothetical protein
MRAALTLLVVVFAQQGPAPFPANPGPPQRQMPVIYPQPPSFTPRPSAPPVNSVPPVSGVQEPRRFPIQQPLPAVTPGPAPATAAASAASLQQFDYRSAQVRWRDGRWELEAGGVWLKDFGQREHDAREALRVMQMLRLTQRGTVGAPAPIMEYWLADGMAPTGLGSNLRLTPIDRNSLRVEEVNKMWCVRDDRQLLFNFGVQKAAAEQAAEVIQRYGFAKVGYVGYPRPTMIYFVGGQGLTPTSLRGPGIKAPRIPKADMPKEPKPQPETTDPRKAQVEALAGYHAQQLARGMRQLSVPLTTATTQLHFDPKQVVVRADRNRWKLYFGNHELADFGNNARGAKQALQVIQAYRCDQQCLIGQPTPAFAYFLVNGHAPRGVRSGLEGYSFRPEKAQLQQVAGGWSVCEGTRTLASFGARRDDAQEMLQAIQRYQFDYAAPLTEGVTLLARSR